MLSFPLLLPSAFSLLSKYTQHIRDISVRFEPITNMLNPISSYKMNTGRGEWNSWRAKSRSVIKSRLYVIHNGARWANDKILNTPLSRSLLATTVSLVHHRVLAYSRLARYFSSSRLYISAFSWAQIEISRHTAIMGDAYKVDDITKRQYLNLSRRILAHLYPLT